VVKVGKPKI